MEQLKPIENLDEMIATKNFEGLTAAMLTDAGICPTCFNKEHDNCLYGDDSEKKYTKMIHLYVFLLAIPEQKDIQL